MEHGVRFPLRAYSPEPYENGMIIAAFLAVPFVALLGANYLALVMLTVAVGTVLVACAVFVTLRLLDGANIHDRRARIIAACLAVFLLGMKPPALALTAASPLGNHHEGAMLNMVVFALLAVRVRTRDPRLFVALWLVAGVAMTWNKGAALAVFAAGLYELVEALRRRGRAPLRVLSAVALVGVVSIPAMLLDAERHFDVLQWLRDTFASGREPDSGPFVLWRVLDQSAFRALVFAAGYGALAVRAYRERLGSGLSPYLFVAATLAIVLAALGSSEDYWIHAYVMLVPAVASLGAVPFQLASQGNGSGRRWLATAAVALLCTPLAAHARLDPGHFRDLSDAKDSAACFAFFGRSFLLAAGDDGDAVGMCRTLGGDRSLACISGISRVTERIPVTELTDEERAAAAFGVGRSRARIRDMQPPLPPDLLEWARLGRDYRCLVFIDATLAIESGSGLDYRRCRLDEPPFRGYYSDFDIPFRDDPVGPPPEIDATRDCERTIARCLGTPVESPTGAPR
jgi:hypothetical protein